MSTIVLFTGIKFTDDYLKYLIETKTIKIFNDFDALESMYLCKETLQNIEHKELVAVLMDDQYVFFYFNKYYNIFCDTYYDIPV